MALIRVTRVYDLLEGKREEEIILNTAHIALISQDPHQQGVWVQIAQGEPLLIKLSFEDIWTLIQRET